MPAFLSHDLRLMNLYTVVQDLQDAGKEEIMNENSDLNLRNSAESGWDSGLRPGRYRHFKGNEYEVIALATDSESLEKMVVYRALYGERGLWVRPLSMFLEYIEINGIRVPRFTPVQPE